MKKLVTLFISLVSSSALANVQPLLGSYAATDLGCATPRAPGYELMVNMTVNDFEPERNSATRRLEVYVKVRREVVVECRVWYSGPISFVEGGFYGSLARTQDNGGRGYDCGALNDRHANGIVSAFVDPYFIETDVITPLNVSQSGSFVSIQQNVIPPKEIRGCGNAFPIYTFKKN